MRRHQTTRYGRLCTAVFVLAAVTGLTACRGNKSPNPPIHLQQNMDFQKRFEMQEANPFFKDGRAMRPQPKHTIAVGELRESKLFYRGILGDKVSARLPLRLNGRLLARGQERYGIYCSRCHGLAGDGKGIMSKRNIKVPPTSYLEPRLLAQPVGHFFQVISKGIRNMPSLAAQIPIRDRWAIAAYVRALQIAGAASLEQVPPAKAREKGWVTQ